MPAITATEQGSYPPRVLVSVTGLTIGDGIALYRSVGGERTAIRGGSSDSVTDTSFVRTDAELPFGVPVTYVAVVNDSAEYSTTAATHSLPGGKVAVSDAINGNAAETIIMAWDEKAYSPQASTFRVGGRNVVVSGDFGMFSGDVEFYTESTSSRDNLIATLKDATEGVVQIRQAGGYDGVDSYLAVLGVTERRFSQDGSDPRRLIVLNAAEVEGWAPLLEALGFTLQDIANVYDVPTLRDNYTFASTTEGWVTPTAGAAVARVATPSEDGDGALRLTPPGAVANPETRAGTTGSTMSGLGSYTVTARIQTSAAWSSGVQAVIRWYDGGSVFLSETVGTVVATAAATWTTITVTGSAPSTALYAQAVIRFSGTPANTVLLYIDDVQVQRDYLTLTNLSADYSTLLAIAQGDFS